MDVTRTDETIDRSQQVGGYTWTIVFNSNTWHDPTDHDPSETYIDGNWVGEAADWADTWPSTGEGRFSKAWGKNVGRLPDMDCSSDGLGTTRGDGSEDCKVTTIQEGTNPLGGTFTLTLDTTGHPVMKSDAICTTGPIAHNGKWLSLLAIALTSACIFAVDVWCSVQSGMKSADAFFSASCFSGQSTPRVVLTGNSDHCCLPGWRCLAHDANRS